MKKYFIFITLSFFVLAGCNQKEKQEISRLTQENQSLKDGIVAKDSSINNILLSLNEIEGNLTTIKEKEKIISTHTAQNVEMSTDVRDRIRQDIADINELMVKNKKQLAWLQKQLKNSNLKIEEFNKMIDQLNQQISEKDAQIAQLNDQLQKLNITVADLHSSMDTLNSEKKELVATINHQTNSMNTAFYVTGTKKELLAENIIKKEGGFIGINKVAKLKPDFTATNFQQVDIRSFDEINLKGKKVELVTTHPSGSYKIDTDEKGSVEKLKITNPEKFWSTSKYLVVMVY